MVRTAFQVALGLFAILLPMHQASAQSTEYELTQIVNERRPLMFDLQTAYWVLLDVQNGKSTDFESAANAARSMSDIMEQFIPLMQPGTARGEAPGSEARPEVWSEADAFEAAAEGFRAQAISFSEVAALGDIDKYKKEFGAFTAACTSCHGLWPSSGGRFRYARDE